MFFARSVQMYLSYFPMFTFPFFLIVILRSPPLADDVRIRLSFRVLSRVGFGEIAAAEHHSYLQVRPRYFIPDERPVPGAFGDEKGSGAVESEWLAPDV